MHSTSYVTQRRQLLAVVLFLCVPLCGVITAKKTVIAERMGDSQKKGDLAIVNSGDLESGIMLCDAGGNATPYYIYDGTVAYISETHGDWAFVIVSNWMLTLEGYVKTNDLRSALDFKGKSSVMIAEVVNAGEEGAPLYSTLHEYQWVLGLLCNNAKVQVIGTAEDHYIVRWGYHIALMPKEFLRITDLRVEPDMGAGIPEIGYVFFDPDPELSLALHTYPNDESERIDHPWLDSPDTRPTEYAIAFLADLGEWYQVRLHNNDLYHGFMRASCFNKTILLDDWLIDNRCEIAPGTYVVGQHVQAGLYTYTVAQGERGVLSVDQKGMPYDKEIDVIGPASYTLYFPQGAKIHFEGCGTLRSTPSSQPLFFSGELPYTRGIFFVNCDFPVHSRDSVSVAYELSLADCGNEGYVIAYNLLGQEISRFDLAKGQTYEHCIAMSDSSMLIEINNCKVNIVLVEAH